MESVHRPLVRTFSGPELGLAWLTLTPQPAPPGFLFSSPLRPVRRMF